MPERFLETLVIFTLFHSTTLALKLIRTLVTFTLIIALSVKLKRLLFTDTATNNDQYQAWVEKKRESLVLVKDLWSRYDVLCCIKVRCLVQISVPNSEL